MKGLFNLSLSGSVDRNLDAGRSGRKRRGIQMPSPRLLPVARSALADPHVIRVNLKYFCARRILAGMNRGAIPNKDSHIHTTIPERESRPKDPESRIRKGHDKPLRWH